MGKILIQCSRVILFGSDRDLTNGLPAPQLIPQNEARVGFPRARARFDFNYKISPRYVLLDFFFPRTLPAIPLYRNSHNARSNYSRGTRLFVSDLVSRRDARRSMNMRVNTRRIVIALREGVGIRDVGACVSIVSVVVVVVVDDPVIVGELAFRSVIVSSQASARRDARQSEVPLQPYRTQTIYGFSTRFKYQVPRFITDDRTAECVSPGEINRRLLLRLERARSASLAAKY